MPSRLAYFSSNRMPQELFSPMYSGARSVRNSTELLPQSSGRK